MRSAKRLCGVVVAVIGVGACFASSALAAMPQVIEERDLGGRIRELTIRTESFTAPTAVRVYLPAGYDAEPDRRWPVTYYLAGTNADVARFESYGGERLTRDFPSIVVAPTANAGWWSDWFNAGAFGPPRYETFFIEELLPLVDARYRSNGRRALFGESMGGYGVAKMAAKHPDLFEAISAHSGGPDTNTLGANAINTLTPAIQLTGPELPASIFGPRATEEVRWRGNNPWDLALNLRGMSLQVRTGDGLAADADPASCALELVVRESTESFHRRLDDLAIPHQWRFYPSSCHTTSLFARQITDALPGFVAAFRAPRRTTPRQFDHSAIEPRFTVWGWEIAADPARALEFLRLERAGRDGFALFGTGTTTVTTPPFFRGLTRVDVDGRTVAPDGEGRIRLTVDLGPPSTRQQYMPGPPTSFVRREVTFAPHARVRLTVTRSRRSLRVCGALRGTRALTLRLSVGDRRGRVLAPVRRRFAADQPCRSLRLRRTTRGRIVVTATGRDAFGHVVRASAVARAGR